MDAAIKQKWVKALRSGKYKQCRESLRKGERYCCLGVLCKIQKADFSALCVDLVQLGEWNAGTEYVDRYRLAQMNDKGASFKQIADHIEANL